MSAPPEDSVPDAPPAGAPRTDRRHYRGVTYDKRSGTWRVRISCLGLQHHVGRYNDQEEAAQMYDKIAYTLYGDAAITNFGVAAAAASDCRVPAHVLALRHKLNAFKWQVQQLQRASTGPAPPPPPPGGAGSSRQPGPPPAAPGAAAGAQPGPLLAPPPAMAPLAGMTPQQVAGMQPQQPMGAPGAYPSLPGSYPSAPQQQQVGWVQAYGMPNPQPQQLVFFGGAPQQPHPQYPMVMGPVNPAAQPHMLQAGTMAMHPGGGVGLQQAVMPGGSSTAFYSMAGPGQVVYLGTASGAALPPGSAPLLVSPFQSVAAAAAAASGTGHPNPAGMGVDQGSSTMQALGGSPVPGVTSGLVTPITGLPAGTFMAISQEGVQGQVDVLQLLQALDARQLSHASSGSSASTQLQLSPSYWGLNPAQPGSIESIATFPVMSSPGLQVAPITSVPMGGASPEPASSGMDAPQAGLLSSFGLLQLTEMQQQQLVFNQAGPSGAQLPGAPHQLPIQAASAAIEALSTGWPAPVSTSETSNLAGAGWQHAASSPALEPLQHVPGQMLMLPSSSTPPAW